MFGTLFNFLCVARKGASRSAKQRDGRLRTLAFYGISSLPSSFVMLESFPASKSDISLAICSLLHKIGEILCIYGLTIIYNIARVII